MKLRQLKIETEFNGILWSDIIYVDDVKHKPPSSFTLYKDKIFVNHYPNTFSNKFIWNIVNDSVVYDNLNKTPTHISFYVG